MILTAIAHELILVCITTQERGNEITQLKQQNEVVEI